jgi:hypothetical protein
MAKIVTNRDKIRYLYQYMRLVIEFENITYTYNELMYKLLRPAPRAAKLSGMPTNTNGCKNPIEAEYIMVINLENKIRYLKGEIVDMMHEIEDAICTLVDPMHRTVMRLRYIQGENWEKICVAINYSWAQTHRIHSDALGKIQIGSLMLRKEK